MRKESEPLEDEGDAALLRREENASRARGELSSDLDLARGRSVEARDQPQQRGLAASRGAEDGEPLAVSEGERELVERAPRPVALGEGADVQERHVDLTKRRSESGRSGSTTVATRMSPEAAIPASWP